MKRASLRWMLSEFCAEEKEAADEGGAGLPHKRVVTGSLGGNVTRK